MFHLLHDLHHLEVLPLADGVALLDDHKVTVVTLFVLIVGKELLTLVNILEGEEKIEAVRHVHVTVCILT